MDESVCFVLLTIPAYHAKPATADVIVGKFRSGEERVGEIGILVFPAFIERRREHIGVTGIYIIEGFGVYSAARN